MNAVQITEKIDRAQALDQSVNAVDNVAETVAQRAGKAFDAMHGTWLGHPLHAAMTDLPIGALTTGTILNLVGADDAADAAIAVGLLAAAPTAIAGWTDWHASKKQSVKRTGLVHAVANVAGLMLFGSSLMAKRSDNKAKGKVLAVLGFGTMLVGAYLGGHMSYNLGAGQPEDR